MGTGGSKRDECVYKSMTLLIDTSEVEPSDRAQYWAQESSGEYHPLQISVGAHEQFSAKMWGDRLSSIRLFRIVADPNTMIRDARDIAAGDHRFPYLQIILRGGMLGAQQDRRVVAHAGDMVAYDSSRTSIFKADETFDLLALQITKPLLGKPAVAAISAAAARIPGENPLTRLTSRFLLEAVARSRGRHDLARRRRAAWAPLSISSGGSVSTSA